MIPPDFQSRESGGSAERTMVRKAGLEPACLSAPPPQDGVSANSTTSAYLKILSWRHLQQPISAFLPARSVRSNRVLILIVPSLFGPGVPEIGKTLCREDFANYAEPYCNPRGLIAEARRRLRRSGH
jgi:hypothetical protein